MVWVCGYVNVDNKMYLYWCLTDFGDFWLQRQYLSSSFYRTKKGKLEKPQKRKQKETSEVDLVHLLHLR